MRFQKLLAATVWIAAACFAAEPDLKVAIIAQAGTPGGGNGVQKPGAEESKPEVMVRVFDSGPLLQQTLLLAETTASEILGSIGVRLYWTNLRSGSDTKSRTGVCGTSGSVQTIDLRFTYFTPVNYKPGALAEAFPLIKSGVRINVFYDRVTKVLPRRPQLAGRILGHVLAHETGHVLMQVANHAKIGLMKAHWNADDYAMMEKTNLRFTPANTILLRMSLARACSPSTDPLVSPAVIQ